MALYSEARRDSPREASAGTPWALYFRTSSRSRGFWRFGYHAPHLRHQCLRLPASRMAALNLLTHGMCVGAGLEAIVKRVASS
jgi:hypothetical protein